MKLLEGKVAVVYGAAGSLGSTVARAFAAEGAAVYLTGINLGKVEALVADINSAGGTAFAAKIDALNEDEVRAHLETITGNVDISFNAISWKDVQGTLLSQMSLKDFMSPINNGVAANFITSTLAAKRMILQKSGVILTLTATPGGIGYPNVGGFGPACSAVELLTKNLASETGPYGIRVVNIRSGGSPDSAIFKNAVAANPEVMKGLLSKMENDTMLKRLPCMNDIANTAIFLASDRAASITGCTIDLTAGTTQALNYLVSPIKFAND